MPLSVLARQAVETVAGRNPKGAQVLLDHLRTAPEAVRRKETDRYGPLRLALYQWPHVLRLSEAEARLCEAFNEEWLRGDISHGELADALEAVLSEVTGRPQDPSRHRPDGWHTLAGLPRQPGKLISRLN